MAQMRLSNVDNKKTGATNTKKVAEFPLGSLVLPRQLGLYKCLI
jgi:hypothetical protein